MHRPAFIVGTGRCGSTLLSGFLREHPAILSLSEFWVFVTDLGGRVDAAFPQGPVTGEQIWDLLSRPQPRQTLMYQQQVLMEEALYRPGPGRRYTAETGIPPVLVTTLSHLSASPEVWFDALEFFVRALPPAPIGTQYAKVFEFLRAHAGRKTWVERSGGSLRVLPQLRQHFPDARYVHLVRDGRDTAVSMSRHLGFRMALADARMRQVLGVDPFDSDDRRNADHLPDRLARYLPERFDADAFRNDQPDVPLCAHYWTGEVCNGVAALAGLGDDLLTLRYEDLLAKPLDTLARLFDHLLPGEPLPDLRAMASRIRSPSANWRELPEPQRREVEAACAPGLAALEAMA